MNKIQFFLTTILVVVLLITSSVPLAQDYQMQSKQASSKTFTFTAIPDQDQSQLRSRFDRVAKYLSEQLGVTVKYLPVKSYAAAITAFRNNQVQLAWFGGLSGVRARQLVPGSEAIAQGEEDQHFVSYFIAHRSTGIEYSEKFPENIKNRTFTFGSKGSTSGRLMPEFYIRENLKQTPQQLFKVVGFSGDHTLTINQVQSGAFQVGAVNFQVWNKMLSERKIDLNKVKVIWKTPEYSDYQWTIRNDINAQFGIDFKEKITKALLEMDNPELLEQFPRTRFVKAQNKNYRSIKQIAIQLGLIEQ